LLLFIALRYVEAEIQKFIVAVYVDI
jgi:hypothetical protein